MLLSLHYLTLLLVLTKDMQVYFICVNYYKAKKSTWDIAVIQDSLYYK